MEKKPSRYKKGLFLTKDNKFVRMHANMTSLSYKITTFFLIKALKEGKLDNLEITASELKDVLNIKTTSLSMALKAEAKKIVQASIEIESLEENEKEDWAVLSLIPRMEYKKGKVTATINPDIMPYISGLTSNFTKTDYEKINACSSYFSMRLAEVCNSWFNRGRAYYSVEEWRGLLGATGKAYDVMSQFRKRVLHPAIEEVNDLMDFTLTPIEHKKGRKVTHIEMIIKPKSGVATASDIIEAEASEKQDVTEILDVISPKLQAYTKPYTVNKKELAKAKHDFANLNDIEQSVVNRMVENYELSLSTAVDAIVKYGISYCTKQMEFVRKAIKSGKNISNKGGYLRKAIEEGLAQSHEAMEQAKAREEEARKNNELWDKQAKDFFQGFAEKSPEELAYEKEYETWSKKKRAFRAELMEMLKQEQIDFSTVSESLAEFDKRFPQPRLVKPVNKENNAKEMIAKLLDQMAMT